MQYCVSKTNNNSNRFLFFSYFTTEFTDMVLGMLTDIVFSLLTTHCFNHFSCILKRTNLLQ